MRTDADVALVVCEGSVEYSTVRPDGRERSRRLALGETVRLPPDTYTLAAQTNTSAWFFAYSV